ncbi:GatB/YqeY domain-containing protein [Lapillicoccus jejuensis]|uniref:Glutamyl-tRNA amidotransferase n=1 Tax=Lapillicoccus jejuensis TaxID=402171 RepID=A0A542DXV5_9MICO|nr:GatB/YqeY domain-containing protein [Lapillicoccus jejuensis]TQJ07923.1 hypothetical protein FB458_0994 [Lapillicoccus jejuensis]
MTLKETLRTDLTAAMKARDTTRSATLRMALTSVTNAEVAGDTAVELDDDAVLKVLAKEAKKRKEAATAYRDANRPELADKEEAELAVLEAYLPQQLGDDEVQELVRQAVAETGATGMAQMGLVMKTVQPLVAGRADGAKVAAAVRAALA